MQLLPPKNSWQVSNRLSNKIFLSNREASKECWYLVRLDSVDNKLPSPPSIHKTDDTPNSNMVAIDGCNCWELIFFHNQPLIDLQIHLPTGHSSAGVTITIKPINKLNALSRMLKSVSLRDKRNNTDASRIYQKSWARWRKKGYKGFLLRLVREYQPQELFSILVDNPYRTWIKDIETPRLAQYLNNKTHCPEGQSNRLPSFSVVIPTQTPISEATKNSIQSVLSQSYKRFELCLLFDSGILDDPDIARLTDDSRVILVESKSNLSLHQLATGSTAGDFTIFLHSGNQLAPSCLATFATHLQNNTDTALIYSDDDQITEEGKRNTPDFKPDWNKDLFYSQNYLKSSFTISREALLQFNTPADLPRELQTHDMLTRSLNYISDNQIMHIPMVLFHRCPETDSHATSSLALRDHFASLGITNISIAPGLLPNSCRVQYSLPHSPPKVSLLIPTRDRVDLLKTCIDSVTTLTTYQNFEIIVLENQSEEEETFTYFKYIEDDSRIRVLSYDAPFNYSAINNFGVKHAQGEVIGLINNDIEVISPEWLTEMVSHALRPEIGCVGAKLYYPDNTIQHAGVILGLWGVAGHGHKCFAIDVPGYGNRLLSVQNYSAVTAACLLVRKEIYEKVGGLNEDHLAVSFNDVDFCLKVREAGYRNLWTPYAELYHHESISRGKDDTPEKKERETKEISYMMETWGEALASDPAYNRNLTHNMENFFINLDHILFPKKDIY